MLVGPIARPGALLPMLLVAFAFIFLFTNAVLYGALVACAVAFVAGLRFLFDLHWRLWPCVTLVSAITVAATILLPIAINKVRHHRRAALVAEDVPLLLRYAQATFGVAGRPDLKLTMLVDEVREPRTEAG